MKKLKKVIIFLLCFGVFCNIKNVQATPGDDENTNITIRQASDIKGCYYKMNDDETQEWTDEACFKDEKLQNIVYDALITFYKEHSDEDNDTGLDFTISENGDEITFDSTNMRAILAGYRGDIKGDFKELPKIKSIKGVQFLTHAKTISLKKNDIEDLTELNVSLLNSASYDTTHYGYGDTTDESNPQYNPDEPGVSRDVYWHLEGNPFRKLPYALGGRLVIAQPATTASNYPDDEEEEFYFVRDNNHPNGFSGKLNIQRCKIMKTNSNGNPIDANGNETTDEAQVAYRDVNISSINFVKATGESTPEIKLDMTKGDVDSNNRHKGFTNETAYFTGILTSRQRSVGIGADQEINYTTVDESELETNGSQSFKYYIEPKFYVYDSISISSTTAGSVEFTKKDKNTGVALAGAVYSLYKETEEIQTGLITDALGIIKVDELSAGNYTLKETKAPDGYKLSNDSINFTITGAEARISGGTKDIITTDTDTQYTGDDYHTYIASNLNEDITLAQTGEKAINQVVVTYNAVKQSGTIGPKESTFTSLQEAQAEINNIKNNGDVYGPIEIEVAFTDSDTSTVKVTATNEQTPNTPIEPPTPVVPPQPPLTPNTGDTTNLGLWVMVGIIALGTMCISMYAKKENRK